MQSEMLKHFSPRTQLSRLKVRFFRILKHSQEYSAWLENGQAFGLKTDSTDRKTIIGRKRTSTEYFLLLFLSCFFTLTSLSLCPTLLLVQSTRAGSCKEHGVRSQQEEDRDHTSHDSPVFYPDPEVIELSLAMVFVLLLVPFLLPAKLFQLADAVRQQEVRRQALIFVHLLWLQGRRCQWDLLRELDRGQGCHWGSLRGWACLCRPWTAKHNV